MHHQKLSRVLIKILDLAMCWEVHLTNILQSFGEKQLIYSTSRQIIMYYTLFIIHLAHDQANNLYLAHDEANNLFLAYDQANNLYLAHDQANNLYLAHDQANNLHLAHDQANNLYPFDQKLEKSLNLTFVDPCIILQFVKKNPTRCNNVSKFLLSHIYMKLSMFRATHRPSSGA